MDAEGWSAANIYGGAVEMGADLDNECNAQKASAKVSAEVTGKPVQGHQFK